VGRVHQKLADGEVASAKSTKSSATTLIVVLLSIAILLAAAIAFFISRAIANGTGPMLRAATAIAEGDVEQDVHVNSRDELGKTAQAFQRMLVYLKEMAAAADRLASGDLTVEVVPKSEGDALGNAFSKMAENLRSIIGEVSGAAATLSASSQMASASTERVSASTEETSASAQEIAASAQQLARTAEELQRTVSGFKLAA
jgi:methyl-accepting chemotaxis protein